MRPEEIRRLAGRWRIPLGVVEKDYAITVALGVIAAAPFADRLVFKGGTALRKMYFADHRFSEDLDFTLVSDVSAEVLEHRGAFMEAGQRSHVRFTDLKAPAGRPGKDSRTLLLRYEDPRGHPNHIRLEFSLRERVRLPPDRRLILDAYDVVDRGSRVPTMALPEMLAEKVRALLMRTQARDLYDFWTLLRNGVPVDAGLVEAKLAWWKEDSTLDLSALLRRVDDLRSTWERDLRILLPAVPRFDDVVREVRGILAP